MNAGRALTPFAVFLALALSLAFGEASAEDTPAVKYPPYPDVWGRELPLLPGSDGRLTLGAPKIDKNGRVLIGYRDHEGVGARRSIDRLYDFFTGKVVGRWIEGEPSNPPGYADEFDYLKKHGFKALDNIVPTHAKSRPLPDGGRLERSKGGGLQYLNYGFRKTNAEGRTVFDWMIIHVADRPRQVFGPTGSSYYSNDGDDFVHTVGLYPKVFSLPDGTFLLLGDRHPLILRYRGNLKSPYIRNSDNILLMDRSRAVALHQRSIAEAEARLIRIRKRNPIHPWRMPEFADIVFTAKIKLLIEQKRKRK